MQKLDIKAFGLACGILWGACVLVLGLTAMAGFGDHVVKFVSNAYIGYKASVLGAIIGGIWGFVDAFIFAAIFAWLYNKLAKQG